MVRLVLVLLLFLASCRWGFGLVGDDTVTPDPDPDAGFVVDDSGELVTCGVDSDCGRCQRCDTGFCQRATFVDLDLGQYNTCAIDERGELWCWGWNQYVSVAEDVPQNDIVPRPRRRGVTDVDRLAVGWGTILVRKSPGGLVSYGVTSGNVNDPQDVWEQLSAGIFAACAISADTTVSCAGQNDNAQLGRGTQGAPAEPLGPFAGGSSGWMQISVGNVTCAIDSARRLFCVGTNNNGELGRGTQSAYEVSVLQVGTDADWVEVQVGDEHVCAIKTNGTLWCWGQTMPANMPQTTPLQIGTATDWSHLESNYRASCALRGGTQLWCGGAAAFWLPALIGSADTAWASMPIAIDPGTRPVLGGDAACIRQGGAWVCWGVGTNGQIGLGALAAQVPPTLLCE